MSNKITYSIGQFRTQEVTKDIIGTSSDNYYSPLCEVRTSNIEVNSDTPTGESSNNNFLVPTLKMNKQYVCSQNGEIVLALDSDKFTKNKMYYAKIGIKKNSKYPCNYNIKLVNDKDSNNVNTQLLKYIQAEQSIPTGIVNHNVVLFQPYYYTIERQEDYDIWYVDYEKFVTYTIQGTLSAYSVSPGTILTCSINEDELPQDDNRDIYYTWYRGDHRITTESTSTYETKEWDLGEIIRCEITLVNSSETKYEYTIIQPESARVIDYSALGYSIYKLSKEANQQGFYGAVVINNKPTYPNIDIYKINSNMIKSNNVDIYTDRYDKGE